MRFDDPPQDDDAPIRPKSIVPSTDRTTRAIRIKLMMLFAMLLVVIVLMKEAGKPARWQWMGFETPDKTETDPDTLELKNANNASPIAPPSGKNSDSIGPDNNAGRFSQPIRISENQSDSSGSRAKSKSAATIDLSATSADFPVAAVRFWSSTFQRLSSRQQILLLQLLKNIRTSETLELDRQTAARDLVQQLQDLRDQFQQSLFDELALVPVGSKEKTRLAAEMYDSQELWEEKISPAIVAAAQGSDVTMGQQQSVFQLQHVLDQVLFQQVQDRTSLGWTGDSGAWIRIWEMTMTGDMPASSPVSRIELMGQPEVFRGKPVSVEGWVRSARKSTLDPDSKLGLPYYYILWIRPRETKAGPFCVYSMTLPKGFPEVSEEFSETNQSVKLSGYSFKVRSYVTADSSVGYCPVILSRGLELVEAEEFTSVDRWQPSRSTLTIAFILIPLAATGLAWLAFRNSKTRQYIPGKKAQQQIDQSLNDLSDDPQVQTDLEKVRMLYEPELHDG